MEALVFIAVLFAVVLLLGSGPAGDGPRIVRGPGAGPRRVDNKWLRREEHTVVCLSRLDTACYCATSEPTNG